MFETFLLTEMSRYDYCIIIRFYREQRRKDEHGLRCRDPSYEHQYQLEIFPLLNVNSDDFKAVTKVKVWMQMK